MPITMEKATAMMIAGTLMAEGVPENLESAFDTPMVQRLLEVLQSGAFRARLEALGGYRLDRPGTVRERF